MYGYETEDFRNDFNKLKEDMLAAAEFVDSMEDHTLIIFIGFHEKMWKGFLETFDEIYDALKLYPRKTHVPKMISMKKN